MTWVKQPRNIEFQEWKRNYRIANSIVFLFFALSPESWQKSKQKSISVFFFSVFFFGRIGHRVYKCYRTQLTSRYNRISVTRFKSDQTFVRYRYTISQFKREILQNQRQFKSCVCLAPTKKTNERRNRIQIIETRREINEERKTVHVFSQA